MSNLVYALNLFNVSNRDEYIAYSRRSAKEVQAHGGRVVALGKFREAAVGEIEPRTGLILVWATDAAENSLVTAAEMSAVLVRCGFEEIYFADVSEEFLPPPPEGTPECVEQAPLSLSVYVNDLAQNAENAARSLREHQIRLFRGVFRVNEPERSAANPSAHRTRASSGAAGSVIPIAENVGAGSLFLCEKLM